MKGEAIDGEKDVNKISKNCQLFSGETRLNTNDKDTGLMRKRKVRKGREKIHSVIHLGH